MLSKGTEQGYRFIAHYQRIQKESFLNQSKWRIQLFKLLLLQTRKCYTPILKTISQRANLSSRTENLK